MARREKDGGRLDAGMEDGGKSWCLGRSGGHFWLAGVVWLGLYLAFTVGGPATSLDYEGKATC